MRRQLGSPAQEGSWMASANTQAQQEGASVANTKDPVMVLQELYNHWTRHVTTWPWSTGNQMTLVPTPSPTTQKETGKLKKGQGLSWCSQLPLGKLLGKTGTTQSGGPSWYQGSQVRLGEVSLSCKWVLEELNVKLQLDIFFPLKRSWSTDWAWEPSWHWTVSNPPTLEEGRMENYS